MKDNSSASALKTEADSTRLTPAYMHHFLNQLSAHPLIRGICRQSVNGVGHFIPSDSVQEDVPCPFNHVLVNEYQHHQGICKLFLANVNVL